AGGRQGARRGFYRRAMGPDQHPRVYLKPLGAVGSGQWRKRFFTFADHCPLLTDHCWGNWTMTFTDCEGFHRRDFLKLGSAGLLGLTLPELLRLEARAAKKGTSKRGADAVIMIWLSGGPASIDMWDLKPEAPENIRGEFKPLATKVNG